MNKRKSRSFRPVVGESRLEDRLVMATSSVHVAAIPVVTTRALNQTLSQVHSAYASFLRTGQQVGARLQHRINAGVLTDADALSVYQTSIANQLVHLNSRILTATRRIPYAEVQGLNAALTSNVNDLGAALGSAPTFADAFSQTSVDLVIQSWQIARDIGTGYIQFGVSNGLFRVR